MTHPLISIGVALALSVVGLASLTAQAPPLVCKTIELPHQGQPDPSRVGGTTFTVPPSVINGVFKGFYSPDLVYAFTPGRAQRVGVINWAIFIPSGSGPKGSIHIWALLCHDGYCAKADLFNNDGVDGVWESDSLSRPINPGETYGIGIFNFTSQTITPDVLVTLQECK